MYLNREETEVITRLVKNASEEDKKIIEKLLAKSDKHAMRMKKNFSEDEYQKQNYNLNRMIYYYRKQRNFEKIAQLEAEKIELKRKYKNV